MRRLLSCIALFVGGIFFIATGYDNYTSERFEYDQSIILNPSSPEHTVTVKTSGALVGQIQLYLEGTHQGTDSAILTVLRAPKEEIGDEGMEEMMYVRGGFGDQPGIVFDSVIFLIDEDDPQTETFIFRYEGNTELTFTLQVEATVFLENTMNGVALVLEME